MGLELPVRFDHAGMAVFRIRMECGVGEVPDYGMSVRVGLSAVQGSDFSLNIAKRVNPGAPYDSTLCMIEYVLY